MNTVPLPNSYWVQPNLLAGEHPLAANPDQPALDGFIQAQLTTFIDLTAADDRVHVGDYSALFADHLRGRLIRYHVPMGDMGVPTIAQMRETLALIDQALAHSERVYVHCWSGFGRTGMVVGCWLVQQGHTPQHALQIIRQLRKDTPYRFYPSPSTIQQRDFVLAWK